MTAETETGTDLPLEDYFTAPLTPEEVAELPAGTRIDTEGREESFLAACFTEAPISDTIFAEMKGRSYKDDCDVPLTDLRYCRVLYSGFDGKTYIGELVVSAQISGDILEIFRALYDAQYPIGKMVLVDDYGGDDNSSMADNNTSAFNYRTVNGTTTLSRHSLGLAIDINPLYNPWIYESDGKTVIDPPAGAEYADRTLDCPYYLTGEDLCTRLFLQHGFTWGGNWVGSKDYQHFSKEIA